jgi:hypothetical protein
MRYSFCLQPVGWQDASTIKLMSKIMVRSVATTALLLPFFFAIFLLPTYLSVSNLAQTQASDQWFVRMN